MESSATAFELNSAIEHWRESLKQSPAFQRENLDELEAHLRDSVATWQQRGLEVDEAFLIATRRIGSGVALRTEFGKVNSREIWLNRALWMLVGIQVFEFMHSLVSMGMGTTLFRLARSFGNDQATPVYIGLRIGLVHLLITVMVVTLGWRLCVRNGIRISTWMRKVPNSSTRLIATALILMLLPPVISMGTTYFSWRFGPNYGGPAHFNLGLSFGMTLANTFESGALILLTLLLARRQLLAKTLA